jgi:hypothetical protein
MLLTTKRFIDEIRKKEPEGCLTKFRVRAILESGAVANHGTKNRAMFHREEMLAYLGYDAAARFCEKRVAN